MIINADQTSSQFVATDNIAMAAQGKNHVSRHGTTDKRAISVTLRESFDGVILPFQLTYTGKTERSLPNVDFPQGFSLDFNEKYWSKETATVRLIIKVLVPYIEKVKKMSEVKNR